MSQHAFEVLASEIKSLEQYRVLCLAISRLDFNNYLTLNQSEMAAALGMAQPSVNRAIKALVQKNILLEGQRVGRVMMYRLNPNYGWKGKAKGHVVALSEVRSARRLAQAAKDKAVAISKPDTKAVGELSWDAGTAADQTDDVPGQMDLDFSA